MFRNCPTVLVCTCWRVKGIALFGCTIWFQYTKNKTTKHIHKMSGKWLWVKQLHWICTLINSSIVTYCFLFFLNWELWYPFFYWYLLYVTYKKTLSFKFGLKNVFILTLTKITWLIERFKVQKIDRLTLRKHFTEYCMQGLFFGGGGSLFILYVRSGQN